MRSSGQPYYRRFTVRPARLPNGNGQVDAHMQDHVHHMKVVITHQDDRVVSAVAEGIRLPWNTCPIGIAGVGRIAGMPVAKALEGIGWPGGRTANCVHMVDLTRMALGHLDETEPFRYSITVTPALAEVREARIERDGRLLLEWTLNGSRLQGAAPFDGHTLAPADFVGWRQELDPALREPAGLLRRACHIAPSRDINLDRLRVAAESIRPDSSCYTLQPAVIQTARRVIGTFRAELTDDDRL